MKKIRITVVMLLTMMSVTCFSETIVKGQVTSADDNAAIPGVNVVVKGTVIGTVTDSYGHYELTVPEGSTLVFSFIGYITEEVVVKGTVINVALKTDAVNLSEVVVTGYSEKITTILSGSVSGVTTRKRKNHTASRPNGYAYEIAPYAQPNTEEYAGINENIFRDPTKEPLSTFSVDVDKAAYSNVRRFINNGQRPPADAVRIEEMINYFSYDYAQPKGEDPFAVFTEITEAPWNKNHKILHIGLQGKQIPTDNLPASNLVFLIDVSGSMDEPNKLPLVKQSLRMLTEQLRKTDHVSIVVYAGASGLVLEPTPGSEKEKIINALEMLNAGGSTAGGAGLRLAYAQAKKHFKEGGNNRVILATDGDFNVGESSNDAMEALITEKRKEGIFLTVLGYGTGNYKDAKMEILADKGNGNYAYIDNISEARKTLVNEFGGTLFTIAKDVKLQLEFNPARVKAYRLIGYENRLLNAEDFNNDKKDAGEIGAGHTVTALYEIIPTGVKSDVFNIDELKYQQPDRDTKDQFSAELVTIKLRYKRPDEHRSSLISQVVVDKNVSFSDASENVRWSASVAAFGMLLRDSEHVKNFSYDQVIQQAQQARGVDAEGYRAEFVNLVKSFGMLGRK